MIARFVKIHFRNLMGMSGGVERESECEATGRAESANWGWHHA